MYGDYEILRKRAASRLGVAQSLVLASVLLAGCESLTKITEMENAESKVPISPVSETTPILAFMAKAGAGSAVQLEDPRSGRMIQIKGGRRYSAASGHTCRLFQATFPPGYEGRPDGVVCRDALGRWEISNLIVNPEDLGLNSVAPNAQNADSANMPPESSEISIEEMNADETTITSSVQVKSDEPGKQEKAASGNRQVKKSKPPSEKHTMELTKATAASSLGSLRVQGAGALDKGARRLFAGHLASVRTRNGTESEWQRLQDLYPDHLVGKKLTIRSIDVPEQGTFYRVLAGPFDEYKEAQDLCTQLNASDQYCVVRRLTEDHDRQPSATTADL